MRWVIPSINRIDKTKWHKWFAWRPVKLTYGNDSDTWVWWEYIERRVTFYGYPPDDDIDYGYRTISND